MIIQNFCVVTLDYRINEGHGYGTLIEETYSSEPVTFVVGAGQIMPLIEKNIMGKKAGDAFAFHVHRSEFDHLQNPAPFTEVPFENLEDANGSVDWKQLTPGSPIQLQDIYGRKFCCFVKEVLEDTVVVDFKHPTKDVQLCYTGRIRVVREATADEFRSIYLPEEWAA